MLVDLGVAIGLNVEARAGGIVELVSKCTIEKDSRYDERSVLYDTSGNIVLKKGVGCGLKHER